jgi:hypothetical protein
LITAKLHEEREEKKVLFRLRVLRDLRGEPLLSFISLALAVPIAGGILVRLKRSGAMFFEIGDKGQRQAARMKTAGGPVLVDRAHGRTPRKSLISMVISGSSDRFLVCAVRPSLPPNRQDQKREKLF